MTSVTSPRNQDASQSPLAIDTKAKITETFNVPASASTALSEQVVERRVERTLNSQQVSHDLHDLHSRIDTVLSRTRSQSPVKSHITTHHQSVVVPQFTNITSTQNIKDIVITKPEVSRTVYQSAVIPNEIKYARQENILQTRYVEVPKRQEIVIPQTFQTIASPTIATPYRTEYKFVHQHKEPVIQTRTIDIPVTRTIDVPVTRYQPVVERVVHAAPTYTYEIPRVSPRPVFETVKYVSAPKVEIRAPVLPPVHHTQIERVEDVHQHGHHHHHCCHGHHQTRQSPQKGQKWGKLENDREVEEDEANQEEEEEQIKQNKPRNNQSQRNQGQNEEQEQNEEEAGPKKPKRQEIIEERRKRKAEKEEAEKEKQAAERRQQQAEKKQQEQQEAEKQQQQQQAGKQKRNV